MYDDKSGEARPDDDPGQDGLEADPNPGRFQQGGGGKIYRDGVLVHDFDEDDDDDDE